MFNVRKGEKKKEERIILYYDVINVCCRRFSYFYFPSFYFFLSVIDLIHPFLRHPGGFFNLSRKSIFFSPLTALVTIRVEKVSSILLLFLFFKKMKESLNVLLSQFFLSLPVFSFLFHLIYFTFSSVHHLYIYFSSWGKEIDSLIMSY